MAEWVAATPWWAFLTIGLMVGALIFSAGIWIGKINTNIGSLKALTRAIQNDIREIRQDIKRLLGWQGSPTIGGKGPLRLTRIGQLVSDALDMPAMAERFVPSLGHKVADKQPYDIQEFCFDYIRDEYHPSAKDEAKIKQCAYNNGLDRDDILDALAIVLRDKLLEL